MKKNAARFLKPIIGSRGDTTVNLLVVLLLLATAGFGFMVYKRHHKKPAKAEVIAESGAQEVSTKTNKSANQPLEVVGTRVDATEACKTEVQKDIRFQHFQMGKVNRKVLTTALLKPDVCVKPGEVGVSLIFGVKRRDNFYFDTVGKIKIESIREVDADKIPNEMLLEENPAAKGDIAKAKASLNAFEAREKSPYKKWAVATFSLVEPIRLQSRLETPSFVTFLNIVHASDLDSLAKSGARFIDVRSRERFAVAHYKLSTNIPYEISKQGPFIKLKNFRKKDIFRVDTLPGPFTNVLVFIGESAYDLAPIRAATAAHDAGWKKVLWLKGGEAERRHINPLTQTTYPFARTISAMELAKKLKDPKIVIVDVRSAKRFERGHIDRAVNAAYELRSRDENTIGTMSARALRNAGDVFALAQVPAGNEVVVYGEDETDYAAIKAAAWLADNGRGSVLWYREGFYDWNHQSEAIDARAAERGKDEN